MLTEARVALVALYLRGAPRRSLVPVARWPLAAAALRRASGNGCPTAKALADAGLWDEAIALEEPGLMRWAEHAVERGLCLSVLCDLYPQRWLQVLGSKAPPAVWVEGEVCRDGRACADGFGGAEGLDCGDGLRGRDGLACGAWGTLSVVGSRVIEDAIRRFAAEVGAEARRLGLGIVSGGALGCDLSAELGAQKAGGHVLEILPFGVRHRKHFSADGVISVCGPDEPFCTANAMERNALIYAASPFAVVCHARFRQGGTWHGACDALRRRLCRVVVLDPMWQEQTDEGARLDVGDAGHFLGGGEVGVCGVSGDLGDEEARGDTARVVRHRTQALEVREAPLGYRAGFNTNVPEVERRASGDDVLVDLRVDGKGEQPSGLDVKAHRALLALGGTPIVRAVDLGAVLASSPMQPSLFGQSESHTSHGPGASLGQGACMGQTDPGAAMSAASARSASSACSASSAGLTRRAVSASSASSVVSTSLPFGLLSLA